MNFSAPDLVGFAGVGLIIGTYFLSQIGRMETGRPLYPALNGLGAALILFSLTFSFNAASFAIEFFWLVISIIGLIRALVIRAGSRRP